MSHVPSACTLTLANKLSIPAAIKTPARNLVSLWETFTDPLLTLVKVL